MANFEIDEDQAALIRELRKLETSDPVHANVYNALFEKLINNDAFLERLANKMVEKSMLCHVLDSVNAQQVLAADVGPKITAITNGLKEDVNGLNTKILELKSYTNEIKYRSYQTVIPIQESWIDGNICNIPFDITTALMTDKPYIFYVLPCSVIGHQVRYDYDLSTSTVAIVSIEFGAQLIAGNNVRFGIFIAGI
ncbi:hypothetical protein [Enterocloster clostridioformis]|jgi:hypothetical protein|uniref:hypothetical protein n=1 Tax=Enterocloster clostridioformis TaxID=1531 RepID=UPI001FAA1847|nr:hypothetical protein [Enterocloster clostridioformis]DAV60768.1 MAG TPA: hypothetical protein [Caudoviricetes sp.]